MHKKQIHTILKKSGISSEGKIEDFLHLSHSKALKKGEYLVEEGKICNKLYFIHQGAVSLFVLNNGVEHVKDFSLDNKFITSFTSFNTQSPSKIFLRAEQDCILSYWHFKDIHQLKTTDLEWAIFSGKMAEILFERKEKRELSLLIDSAEKRYSDLLHENPQIAQIFPQYLISSYLGLRPQSLSRIRKDMHSK